MVASMKPGSVIVDLAVERGGNVEGAEARGRSSPPPTASKIVGHLNVPGRRGSRRRLAQLYAKNLYRLRRDDDRQGVRRRWRSTWDDELVKATMLTERRCRSCIRTSPSREAPYRRPAGQPAAAVKNCLARPSVMSARGQKSTKPACQGTVPSCRGRGTRGQGEEGRHARPRTARTAMSTDFDTERPRSSLKDMSKLRTRNGDQRRCRDCRCEGHMTATLERRTSRLETRRHANRGAKKPAQASTKGRRDGEIARAGSTGSSRRPMEQAALATCRPGGCADRGRCQRIPRTGGAIDPFVFPPDDLRAGDLRRLLRGLVGDAGAAHAADERSPTPSPRSSWSARCWPSACHWRI
jgi:hypothetical protein